MTPRVWSAPLIRGARPNLPRRNKLTGVACHAVGREMDDRKQSFAKMRDYRIAAGLFKSAFEACKRLSSEDRQSLLTKIEKQCSRHPPTAQPKQYKTVEIIGIEIKQSS